MGRVARGGGVGLGSYFFMLIWESLIISPKNGHLPTSFCSCPRCMGQISLLPQPFPLTPAPSLLS